MAKYGLKGPHATYLTEIVKYPERSPLHSAGTECDILFVMREWWIRTMQGRYGQTGADRLNRFILIVALVWFILSRVGLTRSAIPAVLLVAWSYYRMFSRNIPKRYQENIAYCRIADSVKARLGIRGGNAQSDLGRRFQQWKARMQDRTTHHIYRCPSCGQRIRVPRGKGRIEIRCPKCNAAFIKRS